MTDGDGVLVKVDGIPFQTDCFTPAQTVERTEQNWQFKFASFCSLEKSVDLGGLFSDAQPYPPGLHQSGQSSQHTPEPCECWRDNE